jgi:hypothetical protein
MRWVYRGRQVLSAVPDEPQGRVAVVRLDHQGVCPASRDSFDNDFSYCITRTEIMDYLSQTYGPVFVQDLIKHLPSLGAGPKQAGSMPVGKTAPSSQAP